MTYNDATIALWIIAVCAGLIVFVAVYGSLYWAVLSDRSKYRYMKVRK